MLTLVIAQVSDAAGNVALVAYRLLNIVCAAGCLPCQNPHVTGSVWMCGANGVCGSLATSNLSAAVLPTSGVALYPRIYLAGPDVVYLKLGSGYDRYAQARHIQVTVEKLTSHCVAQ